VLLRHGLVVPPPYSPASKTEYKVTASIYVRDEGRGERARGQLSDASTVSGMRKSSVAPRVILETRSFLIL